MTKYENIKQFILNQIESGSWSEFSAVPSENQLATQFNVSRMTARRALQELSDQGVLNRSRGAATTVACMKSQSSIMKIRNIADEIHERGHEHAARCLRLEAIPASLEVSHFLGVEENTTVFHSLILHLENNIPIQLEERFVNPEAAPDYLDQDFTQQTTHHYLTSVAPLTEAEHWVEAVLSSEQQAELLNIKSSEPCLQLSRCTWSQKQRVNYAILLHPGDRYRLGTVISNA